MPQICLYFHVHQPVRLKKFSVFSRKPASLFERYFDDGANRRYFEKAAEKCYLPTNKLLLQLIEENSGRFKISYSITGPFVEQARRYSPETLDSFRALASTNCVEFLDETYHHSLASLYADQQEFERQVVAHSALIRDEFRQTPEVFRNTELLYSNGIAETVARMGYKGILTEGIEWVLGWRSPNYVYRAKFSPQLKVLLRNYKLSDDVGYRFSASWWPEWPLTADKYAAWLSASEGQVANIFMDYETFGEHHWEGSGIREFLRHLPQQALKYQNISFATCSEVLRNRDAVGDVDVPFNLSWADMERDTSAWLGNPLQQACFSELQSLSLEVNKINEKELLDVFGLLQTSDHLYYICTKNWADGDVHKHFSPHKDRGPYDNFINYMNVLRDFKSVVKARAKEMERARLAAEAESRMEYTKSLVSSHEIKAREAGFS